VSSGGAQKGRGRGQGEGLSAGPAGSKTTVRYLPTDPHLAGTAGLGRRFGAPPPVYPSPPAWQSVPAAEFSAFRSWTTDRLSLLESQVGRLEAEVFVAHAQNRELRNIVLDLQSRQLTVSAAERTVSGDLVPPLVRSSGSTETASLGRSAKDTAMQPGHTLPTATSAGQSGPAAAKDAAAVAPGESGSSKISSSKKRRQTRARAAAKAAAAADAQPPPSGDEVVAVGVDVKSTTPTASLAPVVSPQS